MDGGNMKTKLIFLRRTVALSLILCFTMLANIAVFAAESEPEDKVIEATSEDVSRSNGDILAYGFELIQKKATVVLNLSSGNSFADIWAQVANNVGCYYSVKIIKPDGSWIVRYVTGGDGYNRLTTLGYAQPGTYKFEFEWIEGGNPIAGTAMVKICD